MCTPSFAGDMTRKNLSSFPATDVSGKVVEWKANPRTRTRTLHNQLLRGSSRQVTAAPKSTGDPMMDLVERSSRVSFPALVQCHFFMPLVHERHFVPLCRPNLLYISQWLYCTGSEGMLQNVQPNWWAKLPWSHQQVRMPPNVESNHFYNAD